MKQDKIDLHIHTSASDGTWTAEEIVEKIIRSDIKIFSITDHNSVENVEKVKVLSDEAGLILIPGVEIDTSYDGGNYHILGYGIDVYNEELLKLISANAKLMEMKDEESIEFLEKKGLNVSLADYKDYENDNTRGGWKALNYLIDKGICRNTKEFFPLFDGWGNPFDKTKFPSPKEVIEVIKKAGGKPILAHPGAPFYRLEYDVIVPAMLEEGIMGIECYHPENNTQVTQFCKDFCKDNKLFMTGGSDCHGTFFAHRSLGKPSIFYENIVLDL